MSIETRPNWGDFKAFTTLPRQDATVVRVDPQLKHLVVVTGSIEVTLEAGDPALALQLQDGLPRTVRLVRWEDLWVIGVPTGSGHTLYRARTVEDEGT